MLENLSSVFANNKGADQPAYPRSLISAFIIRLLESIISHLAISEFSNFYLVSVVEESGLSLGLSETPKTTNQGFLASRPIHLFNVRYSNYMYQEKMILTPHLSLTSSWDTFRYVVNHISLNNPL